MMYSSLFLAVLAQNAAVMAATMQITVGTNNQKVFTPDTLVAQPGDMLQFNFVSANHSVVSSNADEPCIPQQNAIFSDFQPVAATTGTGKGKGKGKKANRRQITASANTPMFMVPVTDDQPMYIYCSQAKHCQQGMVMVVNPPAAGMGVVQFRQLAAQQKQNLSPAGGISGGQVVNNAAGTQPAQLVGGKGKKAKANN